MTDQEYVAIKAMTADGGSFVKSLAHCYTRADANNRATMRAAFSEIFIRFGLPCYTPPQEEPVNLRTSFLDLLHEWNTETGPTHMAYMGARDFVNWYCPHEEVMP